MIIEAFMIDYDRDSLLDKVVLQLNLWNVLRWDLVINPILEHFVAITFLGLLKRS